MFTYEDFEKMVKVISDDGYECHYNDMNGTFEFKNPNCEEIIDVCDYENFELCVSDWDKICRDLKEQFGWLS